MRVFCCSSIIHMNAQMHIFLFLRNRWWCIRNMGYGGQNVKKLDGCIDPSLRNFQTLVILSYVSPEESNGIVVILIS